MEYLQPLFIYSQFNEPRRQFNSFRVLPHWMPSSRNSFPRFFAWGSKINETRFYLIPLFYLIAYPGWKIGSCRGRCCCQMGWLILFRQQGGMGNKGETEMDPGNRVRGVEGPLNCFIWSNGCRGGEVLKSTSDRKCRFRYRLFNWFSINQPDGPLWTSRTTGDIWL